jgi:hypothetical protein
MIKDDLTEKADEITRVQLYLTLTQQFHDDVWHCSRTEDGLVEIQFYVKEDKNEEI